MLRWQFDKRNAPNQLKSRDFPREPSAEVLSWRDELGPVNTLDIPHLHKWSVSLLPLRIAITSIDVSIARSLTCALPCVSVEQVLPKRPVIFAWSLRRTLWFSIPKRSISDQGS